jgi:hypothetical protein
LETIPAVLPTGERKTEEDNPVLRPASFWCRIPSTSIWAEQTKNIPGAGDTAVPDSIPYHLHSTSFSIIGDV